MLSEGIVLCSPIVYFSYCILSGEGGMEQRVKAFCLLLLGLNGWVLAASYIRTSYWSYEVCRNAFGMCDYPWVPALAIVASAGLFIVVKEID